MPPIYLQEAFLMKKKSKHAKLQRKSEFRFHKIEVATKSNKIKKTWHPAYVFLEKGNIFIYVSITHSDSVNNTLLIKLKKNPNPKDKTDSYYLEEIKEDTEDRFGRKKADWEIDSFDDHQIRKLFKNKKR